MRVNELIPRGKVKQLQAHREDNPDHNQRGIRENERSEPSNGICLEFVVATKAFIGCCFKE